MNWLIEAFAGKNGSIDSNLSSSEVLRAIADGTDEAKWDLFSMSGHAGKKSILSKITDTKFTLIYRIFYRNSFARRLYGKIESRPNGCRISYKLCAPLSIRVFMGIWLTGVISIGTVIAIHQTEAAFVPIMMSVFGILLISFGHKLGSGNEQKMLDMLKTIASGGRINY